MTNRIDTAVERVKLSALEGHTPWPWGYREGFDDYEIDVFPDFPHPSGSGLPLAELAVVRHHPETPANARLIAAAPDLKDTLATALDEIDRLREALQKIESAPAWGYPDQWETTPAEVRQLARDDLRSTEARHDD